MFREPLDAHALDQIFRTARTYPGWLDREVTDAQLRELYELLKWGPTTMNTVPARILFVKSAAEKAKLVECVTPGNVEKTRTAPVTAIVGYDVRFFEHMPLLAPHNPNARAALEAKSDNETTALRNGALQGGYLIVAARALGLDCGPMAGFDHDKVNAAFWAGTSVKTNFLCNLGYGDPAKVKPRAARLSFDEACRII
jgi:3-hydroxypropanoate dehydrogenase